MVEPNPILEAYAKEKAYEQVLDLKALRSKPQTMTEPLDLHLFIYLISNGVELTVKGRTNDN